MFPPNSGVPEPPGFSGYDDLVVAAEMGFNLMDGPRPRPEELPVGSTFGAILAAAYVTAALLRHDSEPQHIVVPLTSAALYTVARRVIKAADDGLVDPVAGPRLPIAARYRCADGRYIQSQGGYSRFVDALISVIDKAEWLDDARRALGGLPDVDAEEQWRARFADVFSQRTAKAWEDAINAAGGACTLVRSREEWLAEPHSRATGIVVSDDGPPRCGPAVRVLAVDRAATTAEQHGSSAQVPPDPPLSGTVVLDLSIVLAGPTCGRTLSDFGAEVIKIDDPARPISPYGWLEVNRGKRSMLLNLRAEPGRQVLRRLISRADVLIENYRHGKLDEIGFGFPDVVKLRPDIVYVSLNAFDVGGSWDARAGWEQNAQAATGMQIARGGDGKAPAQVPFPLNDFGTGLLGAYGVMLALRQRNATGAAQRVIGSLSRTATFMASPLFEETFAGKGASGVTWLNCSDGFVAVLHPAASPTPAELVTRAERIAGDTCRDEAIEALRAIGLTCAAVHHTDEIAAVPWIRNNGLVQQWDHPRWGTLTQARPRGWASTFESAPSHPAPDPGEDVLEILGEHGYTAAEIEGLFQARVVSTVPLFDMWTLP